MYKSWWQKLFVALLVVLCTATFFACGHEVGTQGLEIVEDQEQVADLTPQEIEQLSACTDEVLKRAMISGTSRLSQAIEAQLHIISQYMAQEVALLRPANWDN